MVSKINQLFKGTPLIIEKGEIKLDSV